MSLPGLSSGRQGVSAPPAIVSLVGQHAEDSTRALFDRYVANTYKRSLVLSHGKGTRVWDANGRSYLDLAGGIAVNALGHAHPRMVRALEEQARKLIHVSNLYYHEPQGLLAERLVKLTGPGKVFFCNSGAEGNEALYKLARRFGHESGRFEIITCLNSFHGRTLAGIAATGQEKIKAGFGPAVPGFVHVPFNDLAAVEKAITPQTAAVLIEGIQGEGGVTPATADFLLGLRALTRKRNLLLMMDAVQCGMFRTGKFQSYERVLENHPAGADFLPDAISMAKSLGGGFPIGAVWMHERVADLLQPGSHGTTYGGTPLACAVALAVLDVIAEENLADNIRARGEQLAAGLETLKKSKPIKLVRGLGGMLGAEIEGSHLEAVGRLANAGLLIVPAGTNVLRFLPPLNISAEEVDEALAIMGDHL